MKTPTATLAVATLMLAACSRASSSNVSVQPPSGGGGGGAVERPAGPQTLRKGESHEVEINAGQTHEWGIQLAAGERVTFSIQASSTGATLCQNWTWGYYSPSGGTLRETPMQPSEQGRWSADIEGTAEPSVVEGPTAGRYVVRVAADGQSCPQLRYTLRAR
jgi:hypothetical protein